ncbi:MAG: UDP-glucose--hexose-1-phosphate uridylyltransferase [Bacilli bacterium]|nr:UDP-glucose--hexose-1-phosphate uridylyltransferase [Bacilli bacterium]
MTINYLLNELLNYALKKGFLKEADYIYSSNVLIDFFNQKEFYFENTLTRALEEILDDLASFAYKNGILKNNDIVSVDNFKAKTIDFLIDKPKEICRTFFEYYQEDPNKATDYLYQLSKDVNYIQTKRINQNIKWKYHSEYGVIDLTINLSKPEKDPRLISLQKLEKSAYPKCQLCPENEGYRGHVGFDARSNMRIIPLNLNHEDWYFQYSPYSYFDEHSIVLNKEHIPMIINREPFIKLLDFLDYFPEYFVGSNAGLPIVGGSILNHEHYQSGKYRFPIEEAEAKKVKSIDDVDIYAVKWPLSTIRIKSKNRDSLINYAAKVLEVWKAYENVELSIINKEDEIHNTITPISRKEGKLYVFDLILRNNYTTSELPDGVFHPHPSLHHIKKENIGLIEAMGLGVLPARLKQEFELIAHYLQGKGQVVNDQRIKKHWHWVQSLEAKYQGQNVQEFILQEAGGVFSKVLKDAGVFKMDEKGQKAYFEFLELIF